MKGYLYTGELLSNASCLLQILCALAVVFIVDMWRVAWGFLEAVCVVLVAWRSCVLRASECQRVS